MQILDLEINSDQKWPWDVVYSGLMLKIQSELNLSPLRICEQVCNENHVLNQVSWTKEKKKNLGVTSWSSLTSERWRMYPAVANIGIHYTITSKHSFHVLAAALLQLSLICISTKTQITCRKMNCSNASVVGKPNFSVET